MILFIRKFGIFCLVTFLISSGKIYSQIDTSKVNWISFEETKNLFEKRQKPVLVYFYDSKNDSSRLMLNETFGLNEVASYINILFYPVKLDIYSKDTVTFFDGTKFYNSGKNGKFHDIVVQLLGTQFSIPSMILFNKQAQGAVFPGFKDRNHIFPILIYYAESLANPIPYDKFEKYYFETYPIGQKQIMTRVLVKWKTFNELPELMKTKPRKIMVNLYDNYNISSTMQRLKTYNNPLIAKYLNEKFYCTNLDVKSLDSINFLGQTYINEKAAHGFHQLAIAMLNGNMQFPAFIVIDENSKLLDRFYGYMSPDDFEVLIHFIGDDDYKNEKWDEYKLNFKGSFSEAKENKEKPD
jgi:thioredoxin-related protein